MAPRQDGIARVRAKASEPVVGTAFLISPRHAMTCAHVVNEALGLSWDATEHPTESVWVEFLFAQIGGGTGFFARVVEWRPPGEGPASDTAVLELEREAGIRPYRTAAVPPERGQRFWTKGFPAGHDGGMDATGRIGTAIEHGRLFVEGDALPNFFIEGGFSGTPLLDEASSAVLGMAAEAERNETKRIAIVVPAAQLELAWPPLARPYKGLSAFQEADARFFHGRERAIEELAAKLQQMPLVTVVGRSGSGKSSLVRAGLVPRLRAEEPWCVVTFRPGAPSGDPFRNVAAALIEATHGRGDALGLLQQQAALDGLAASLRDEPDSIVEHLQRLMAARNRTEPARLLLVADQFEELFTVVADPVEHDPERSLRARFVQCLRAATDTSRTREPAARCVLTIRADYMGRALGVRDLADALRDADVKLGPMTASELRLAIEEPARALGVAFEDGLVDELMQAVGGSGDALPLLEFTLAELWSKQRDRVIRRVEATRSSQASEVLVSTLTRHAEVVFEDLSRRFGEARFRKVLVSLVWLGDPNREGEDTRRVRRKGEFEAGEWELVEQLAGQDRQARLVTTGTSHVSGEPTAEIVHEALIRHWTRLRGWLDEDRAFRLWLQKVEGEAAEWQRSQDASDLLQGRRLAEAERWREERAAEDLRPVADYVDTSVRQRDADRDRRNEEQKAHITALEAARERERRMRGRAMVFAAFAVVLASVAGAASIAFYNAQTEAEAQTREAVAQRDRVFRIQTASLASAADIELAQGDAVTALLLALERLEVAKKNRVPRSVTAQAERAAYSAMLQQRELEVLRGHEAGVHSVAFSPDGKRLATASRDGTAQLWDAVTGRAIGEPLRGHEGEVWSVAFSPDGKRLATASLDRTARLWDAVTGRTIGEPLRGHANWVFSVAFSPDGERLATASLDHTARLWDAVTGRAIGEPLRGHEAGVFSVAFSPDGKRLATASDDGTARLWDAVIGRAIGEPLRGHEAGVLSVAFSPDGERLATASKDEAVRVWDLDEGGPELRREMAVLRGHGDWVHSVAFSPDGKRLATASYDRTARLWGLEGGGRELAVLRGHTNWVLSVAFSPDGKRLATASDDRTARLWDAEEGGRGRGPGPELGHELAVLHGHGDRVLSVAFSPDGERLATASNDHTARLWEAVTGRAIGEPLRGHEAGVHSVAFSPDGKRLATASDDGTARLWDAVTEGAIGEPLRGHEAAVFSVAFSPDGKRLATASYDHTARLWDAVTGRAIGEPLRGHDSWVLSVAFSPDGTRLATTSDDGTARLWDAVTGGAIGEPLRGHEAGVFSVAFSPDGKRLATASYDRTARLWNAEEGGHELKRELATLRGHANLVSSVAFSPDGERLATASWDRTARLWDAEEGGRRLGPELGHELAVLHGHGDRVLSVAFSPDGKRLATASYDRTARLWDVYRSRDELLTAAVARLPRCLSPAQKVSYGLAEVTEVDPQDTRQPAPPCW